MSIASSCLPLFLKKLLCAKRIKCYSDSSALQLADCLHRKQTTLKHATSYSENQAQYTTHTQDISLL